MFDTSHPWLQPVWVRIGIVAVCLIWAISELARGAFGWAAVFVVAGGYAGYVFFRNRGGPDDPGKDLD